MSFNDQIEQRLASTPTRQLTPDGRRQIVDAILAADRDRRDRWWSRRIPVWQAAAACIAACLVSFLVARTSTSGTVQEVQPPLSVAAKARRFTAPSSTTFVNVNPTVFGARHRTAYRTDITRWGPLETDLKGP